MLIKYLLFSCVTLLVLVACAPKTTLTSAPTGQTELTPNRTSWELAWESALTAAKKEGKVVVYGSSPIPAINKAANQLDFSKKYGFVPEFISGKGAEIINRVLTERRAGLFVPDILITGMNTFFGQLKPAGIADPLEPALILPEVVDPKLWYGGKLRWGDSEHLVFQPLAWPVLNISINTELVNPNDIKSWRDILNPKWKGKILMNDPTVAGTALKGFGVLGFKTLDLDFFRSLAKQEPLIMRDERLTVDWLAKGKYSILVFANDAPMTEYTNAGAPIAYVFPVEGTYLASGGANVVLASKAPHPNAAKVFINWYLSREAQTPFSKNFGAQSARLDVPTEGIEPLKIRKSGEKYFLDADIEEWLARDPEFKKAAEEIFGQYIR